MGSYDAYILDDRYAPARWSYDGVGGRNLDGCAVRKWDRTSFFVFSIDKLYCTKVLPKVKNGFSFAASNCCIRFVILTYNDFIFGRLFLL